MIRCIECEQYAYLLEIISILTTMTAAAATTTTTKDTYRCKIPCSCKNCNASV